MDTRAETGDDGPGSQRAAWILPGRQPGGLPALVAVVRDRWWLALLVAVAVVAVAVGAFAARSDSYKAESLLIVSPSDAPAISQCGLDVINNGGGLTRDVETLARLVKTPVVARRARTILKSPLSPTELLKQVDAAPIGQSFLVSITATTPKRAEAAAIANAFAQATVAGRNARFNRQVSVCRKRLEASLGTTTNADVEAALVARVADLRALQGGGDPTVAVDTRATAPTAPSSPGLVLVLLAAIAAGVALGLGAAALATALNRRIDSETQLGQEYALPVVARVPARHGQRPVSAARSSQLTPLTAEAFRRLRQRILASSRGAHGVRSVLFTSASRREGRTTAAINTSIALIETGQQVLLVDLDLRHPNIAAALRLTSDVGVHDVLERRTSLRDAVSSVPVHSGSLDVLLAFPTEDDLVDQIPPATVRDLIGAAQELGYDVVVFDAPALGSVSDALSIAVEVDDVFVVVWRKRTLKAALAQLARTCADHDITPRGFLVLGAKTPSARRRDSG